MYFFERIADYEFRIDRNGRLVFCPWGFPLGGAIIPTNLEKIRVRQAFGRLNRDLLFGVSLPVVTLFAFDQIPFAILWALIGSIWFLIMRHRIVRGLEVTNEFLPFARCDAEASRELIGLSLAFMLTVFCGAIAFAMFYSATLSASPISGVIGGMVFVAFAAFALYAIVKKFLS